MSLLTLLDVNLSFGGPHVLRGVNLQVDAGERVCLLGRNGSGKSSLMRLITGEINPDSGKIFRQPGAAFARLSQEIPADVDGTAAAIIGAAALEHQKIHHEEDWQRELRVEQLLARLGVRGGSLFSELSGGLKRRVLLARALAAQPDLLLLDEPTNHLDIESIEWLEEFLPGGKLGLFFVTHDRAFLKKLATRILELDRGSLSSWACDYDSHLARKEEVLAAEEKNFEQLDKKLAREEAWLRQGVKARRGRNQGRVHALKAMREERRQRREREGSVSMKLSESAPSGMKVIETKNLRFAWGAGAGTGTGTGAGAGTGTGPGTGDKLPPLVGNLSTTIMRGDKIGIIGPNGSGKTTLIKLLLGELTPTSGEVKHGTNLEIVYLDQMRAQIDDDKSVADNIADGNTTVTIDGRALHVVSYLQDFLFSPERSRTPARVLSGGERNRLLLARLFTKPANLLVLDEPTNDLDSETLDLLENLLVEYQGTLLLVSHDRDFLDNVVTSTLVLEGGGVVGDYVGGYSDYVFQRERLAAARAAGAAAKTGKAGEPPRQAAVTGRRKLLNREKVELAGLPEKIEAIEREQGELMAKLGDPDFYARQAAEVCVVRARLEELEKAHAVAFARWEELESRTGS